MQKILNLLGYAILSLCLAVISPVIAENKLYGAAGVAQLSDQELNLETMLTSAIQDEYLARGEYQKIIDKFGYRRPFTNIIKAEERHISLLIPLLEKFKVTPPSDRGLELASVPATFAETLPIGAAAEVANITMYQRFLKQNLPEDVRHVFRLLLNASQNHLAAFTRQKRARE
ncbi:MAG: hypothetical protein OQK77_11850 [Psychromonas sp.]|nr:hypothetical protein [Psychromonas sp.]